MKTAIELTSLLLVGWIAGAELGSWCCVQPVVARLPLLLSIPLVADRP